MDIDLSKFNLETGAVHPYQDVVLVGGKFLAYEGAFGKRYRYFEIAADSGVGEVKKRFFATGVVGKQRVTLIYDF